MMRKTILITVLVALGLNLYANEKDFFFDYIGDWKIASYFSIDGIMEEYLTAAEAQAKIGKVISYKKNEFAFDGKLSKIVTVNSDYLTDEQLWTETVGSGTPGFRFADLGIKNLNLIRNVWFKTGVDRPFGFDVFILNNWRIIIQYKGFFFIADKIN